MELTTKVDLNDKQIKELLHEMVILIDTREKKNAHILTYLASNNYLFDNQKLDYGDYSIILSVDASLEIPTSISFTNKIVIERKNSLEELASNFGMGRKSFEMEMMKAKVAGCKMFWVIEGGQSIDDIIKWNYESDYTSQAFIATFMAFMHRYNITPIFTSVDHSGKIIHNIFKYYLREYLKNG